MDDRDFNELSGRVDGLARAYLELAAALQRQGVVDEQQLQASLRIHADALPEKLATAARTLTELADTMLRHHMQKVRGLTPEQIAVALAPDDE